MGNLVDVNFVIHFNLGDETLKEVFVKRIEVEEHATKISKEVLQKIKKRTSAKTPSGIILGDIQKIKNSENFSLSKLDLLCLLDGMYHKVKSLEVSQEIKLKGWKGKSSFEVIKKPDKFIVITFQKPDKDSEPKKIKRDISKEEINKLYWVLDKLNEGKKISSRDIGELYYKKRWENVFSDRYQHTQLNLMLRLLDYFGLTHYRGKYTTILKSRIELQNILK